MASAEEYGPIHKFTKANLRMAIFMDMVAYSSRTAATTSECSKKICRVAAARTYIQTVSSRTAISTKESMCHDLGLHFNQILINVNYNGIHLF